MSENREAALVAEVVALTAERDTLREIAGSLFRSYESRRRVHIGQGPVSGQIGAAEYDRYWHALNPREECKLIDRIKAVLAREANNPYALKNAIYEILP